MVFSLVTTDSTVFLLFASPLPIGFWAPWGETGWPARFGQGSIESPTPVPALSTWVSGTMELCPGAALKKVDSGEEMMIGSGRTKPLRSQLGMEFSSVFITRVSMA